MNTNWIKRHCRIKGNILMNKMYLVFILMVLVTVMESCSVKEQKIWQPNILFVFADQLRPQELSCYGGANIQTPNLDRLDNEDLIRTNAISTFPICTPFRGMLLTALYPLKSRISNNDHLLNSKLPSFVKACEEQGYNTAYIGKWHLDGRGRTAHILKERPLGFEHWQALECTHNYFNSKYFDNYTTEPEIWEGFGAELQTRAAQEYIKTRDTENTKLIYDRIIKENPNRDILIDLRNSNPGRL